MELEALKDLYAHELKDLTARRNKSSTIAEMKNPHSGKGDGIERRRN
jgi:hypothetical protein